MPDLCTAVRHHHGSWVHAVTEQDRWKNRRRMAWVAMWSSMLYPLLLIAQADGVALSQIAGPFYLFTGAVVGAYIGFATWDDKGKQ